MHTLLARQLRKLGIQPEDLDPVCQVLLGAVDAAYESFDADRIMLERAMDLSSQELMAANSELRASEDVLRRTLQATEQGVLAIDDAGKVLHVNDRYFDLLGVPRNIFDIPDPQERLRVIASNLLDPDAFLNRMQGVFRGEVSETFDVLALKDGRIIERSSRPLRGDSGRVWSYRDITDSRILEEQLRHQAFHDGLTGLPNRARFLDRLELALERTLRDEASIFVLFVDIDDFKAINDSLGHSLGDETLRVVAERLRAPLRPGDTAARLGGDEFAFLLEGLSSMHDAKRCASEILEHIRKPMMIETQEIVLDASIGIVEGRPPATAEEVLRNADIAMYAAKSQGKGRTQVYLTGMHATVKDRQALTGDLRHAVQREELLVLYQPCWNLQSDEPSGAEALVRWNHPSRGLIVPDEFIPIAEDSGAIQGIGRHVLTEACSLLAAWQREPETAFLSVNVNVSAKQVLDPGFVAVVNDSIRDTRISPGGLTLEITETAMIKDPERCLETLNALKRLGVRLALDDFGTGYSSLSYLKRFPIDVLKIDKSFIQDLYGSEREILLTTATIAFGKSLNLKVFAEGIETQEQLDHLRALECEYGQGYFISRPLGKSEISQFVRKAVRSAA